MAYANILNQPSPLEAHNRKKKKNFYVLKQWTWCIENSSFAQASQVFLLLSCSSLSVYFTVDTQTCFGVLWVGRTSQHFTSHLSPVVTNRATNLETLHSYHGYIRNLEIKEFLLTVWVPQRFRKEKTLAQTSRCRQWNSRNWRGHPRDCTRKKNAMSKDEANDQESLRPLWKSPLFLIYLFNKYSRI